MNDVYQDDLKAYLDKELPLFRRLAVREHLTRCASCREEITQMTQMTTELRKAEADLPLDSALRARILGSAFTDVQGPVFNAPRARRAQDRILKYGLAASVVVNALFVTWVAHSDVFRDGALLPPSRETQIKVFKRPPPPKPQPKIKPPPPPPPPPKSQVMPPPLHVTHVEPPRPIPHTITTPVHTSFRSASNFRLPPSPPAPTGPILPAVIGPVTAPPAPPTTGTETTSVMPAPHTEVSPPPPPPAPLVPPPPPPPPVQPMNWVPIDTQAASVPDGLGSDVSVDGIDAGSITNAKVVISFTIDEIGRFRNARVKESCGSSELDNRFLEAVKRAHGTPAVQDHIPRDQPYSLSFSVGG